MPETPQPIKRLLITAEEIANRALKISEEIMNFTKQYGKDTPAVSLLGGLLGVMADLLVYYTPNFNQRERMMLTEMLNAFYEIARFVPPRNDPNPAIQ